MNSTVQQNTFLIYDLFILSSSIKFGGLAVEEATVKFKSVKFKCARDLRDIRIILRVRVRTYYMYGTTAKFKDHQYFRLYGIFFLK